MEAGIRTLLMDTGISSSGTSTDSMSTVTDKEKDDKVRKY